MKVDFEINKQGTSLQDVFYITEDEKVMVDEVMNICCEDPTKTKGEDIDYIINKSKNYRELILLLIGYAYCLSDIDGELDVIKDLVKKINEKVIKINLENIGETIQ